MSIKVISLHNDGVSTRDIEELSKDELIDIELALMTTSPRDLSLSCITCHSIFQGGNCQNKCEKCR